MISMTSDTHVLRSAALRVHATVPESLTVTDRQPSWERRDRGVEAPRAFLEGPVCDGAGGLYLVDVAWGRILQVDRNGNFRVVVEYEGEPNGLALAAPDRLLVADYRRGLVEVTGLSGQPTIRVLAEAADGTPFHGLNDLVIGSDGAVYATDQGDSGLHAPYGRLVRIDPSGAVQVLLHQVPSPNGLVLDERASTLFLAVTRDNAVWRVPLPNGMPHRVGRYLQLSGGIGPDGLAAGPYGTLLVAHLGLGVVWVYDAIGVPILRLMSPAGRATTNLCLDDSGRVFITESESSTVLTADLRALLATLERSKS